MRFTIEQVAAATRGTIAIEPARPDEQVCDLSWDSRTVNRNDLFVALPGERVDGHDYVCSALHSGALIALVEHITGAIIDCAGNEGAGIVVVPDTAQAIIDLAAAWREQLSGRVIGLTGSTGKTTTKELVAAVLSTKFSTKATIANQNNELGVPKTVLSADADTEALVVEMGMRGTGQLADLCTFVKPEWGLVTNVGESHIELLGSRENIALAKAELLAALPDRRGVAFVNAADNYSALMCEHAKLRKRGVNIVFFEGDSSMHNADALGIFEYDNPFVWASDIELDETGCASFALHARNFETMNLAAVNGDASCTLKLPGVHNVSNAAAAAAVGLASGLELDACAAALESVAATEGRQRFVHTSDGITIIDDAYNANPDSMRAALDTLDALTVHGRRIAVLGDMGELGDFSEECHRRVGGIVAKNGVDRLICVGPLSAQIAREARLEGMKGEDIVCFDTSEEALADLKSYLKSGDVVLVKASHFMEFNYIVEGLVG